MTNQFCFRQSLLSGDLERANEEIQRLKKLLKRPSSMSSRDSSLPPTPTNIVVTPPASKTSITISPVTVADPALLPDRPILPDDEFILSRVTLGQ